LPRKLLAMLMALALALAACGTDDDDGAAGEPAGNGGDVPERIVSLSPTATEMLFAIGAGDRVVAVDDQSNHPPEAPVTELSGFQPNVEAIAGYDPDLVVISNDPGDVQPALEQIGVEVLMLPAAAHIDDVYDQIERLGAATGNEEEADDLVDQMRADIDELVERAPEGDEPMTYYHELDETFFSVTSDTFIGAVYGLVGLESIADAAPDTAGGYPQLSAEFILDADPDFIFLAAAAYGQTADVVGERPGWSELSAVQDDRLLELDQDTSSRWGPRIVDFLREVVEAMESASVPAGAGAGNG
jgi:iron complex transport system substrate-binding protein